MTLPNLVGSVCEILTETTSQGVCRRKKHVKVLVESFRK